MKETLKTLQSHVRLLCSREQKARLAAETIRQSGGYRWVGLYDVEEASIAVIAWSGPGAPTYPRFPRNSGLNGVAVANGTTVVVQDVREDSRYLQTLGDTLAEMIVPVRSATGAIVGTIDVESAAANAFSKRDEEFLGECAAVLLPLWTEKSV